MIGNPQVFIVDHMVYSRPSPVVGTATDGGCSACPCKILLPFVLSGRTPPQWFVAITLEHINAQDILRNRGHINSIFTGGEGGKRPIPRTAARPSPVHPPHPPPPPLVTISRVLRPGRLLRVSILERALCPCI